MIVLLGFPKSGTTSFQVLFKTLGYKSYHWRKGNQFIGTMIHNNKKSNKPLLHDFLETDVITQMDVCTNENNAYWPQLTDYKQLYYENKNTIFILNKRDPVKILNSFKSWNNFHGRLLMYNPELLNDNSDDAFIRFVRNHYKKVEEFFKAIPQSKFISFDIEKDKLEKLNPYIDLKQITVLPQKNKNPKSKNNSI
jgi:hypothetical protein